MVAVVSAVNSIFLALIDRDLRVIIFKPYYLIYTVILFLIALVCLICFYRRKIIFRLIYIFLAAISIAFLIYYNLSGDAMRYIMEKATYNASIEEFYIFMNINLLVISIGISVVFIIALYRSKRVKNTFR